MKVNDRINVLRHIKEKELLNTIYKRFGRVNLNDNDRLWVAVTSIIEYLEELNGETK